MNRCGVPLIEIVSEPDIRSAEEAVAYLRKLRAILTYTGVSDCRMNEGSMRCDVNLSVRRPGEPFGVRTEMKNLNSFQSVERAIEAEYRRQVEALETGEGVVQETRRYDQKTGKTTSMRRKENSADYRYFPDPDLPEIYLSDAEMAEIRASIPALPDERRMRYMQQYGLTAYAAEQLTAERWLAEYFERAAGLAESPVALCNLILGEVFAQITLRDTAHTGERGPEALPIAPEHLAALSDMIGMGKVNRLHRQKNPGRAFRPRSGPRRLCAGPRPVHPDRSRSAGSSRAGDAGEEPGHGENLSVRQNHRGKGPHGQGHGPHAWQGRPGGLAPKAAGTAGKAGIKPQKDRSRGVSARPVFLL